LESKLNASVSGTKTDVCNCFGSIHIWFGYGLSALSIIAALVDCVVDGGAEGRPLGRVDLDNAVFLFDLDKLASGLVLYGDSRGVFAECRLAFRRDNPLGWSGFVFHIVVALQSALMKVPPFDCIDSTDKLPDKFAGHPSFPG